MRELIEQMLKEYEPPKDVLIEVLLDLWGRYDSIAALSARPTEFEKQLIVKLKKK